MERPDCDVLFKGAIEAWGSPRFDSELLSAFGNLAVEMLPLQQAMTLGSHVADGAHNAMIIASVEKEYQIEIKLGVFFGSVIAGCSCADDPSPIDVMNEYCEMLLIIDKSNGKFVIHLHAEDG